MSAGRAGNPDDLRWLAGSAAVERALRCPACGVTGAHRPVLAVPSSIPPHPLLTFLHCAHCGSGQFDPPGITNVADHTAGGDAFWRHYVEVGGGIWETIWPLLADKSPDRQTLLDVGCGFGFAVDFWQRVRGGQAVGVELADYGEIGARTLGITVHRRMLQDEPALAGRRFDVVHASEVIEHVPDPAAFVALLARYVADDGVLVLTTPSRESIDPARHSLTLLAALSPGCHGFLLSAEAFADTARRAGFGHVVVRRFDERQVLWASRAPITVDPAPGIRHPDYLAYLHAHVARFDGASPVWQGMAYRLTKELINANRGAEATALARRLTGACAMAYGPQVEDPEAVRALLRNCRDLADAGRHIPFFLPGFYFYLGLIALHYERDLDRAGRMFAGATGCTREAVRLGQFLDAVAVYWPARVAEADIRFARGDIAGGARMYAQAAAEGGACAAENGYALADRTLLESRVPTLVEHLLAAGHAAAAAEIYSGYCAHVTRDYGKALLSAPGVDAALGARQAQVPLDPLFAPAFAAILLQRGTPASGESLARLAEVRAVAARWSADPVWGRRMRDHALRLGRLQPAAPPSPFASLSYRFSYKPSPAGSKP